MCVTSVENLCPAHLKTETVFSMTLPFEWEKIPSKDLSDQKIFVKKAPDPTSRGDTFEL